MLVTSEKCPTVKQHPVTLHLRFHSVRYVERGEKLLAESIPRVQQAVLIWTAELH